MFTSIDSYFLLKKYVGIGKFAPRAAIAATTAAAATVSGTRARKGAVTASSPSADARVLTVSRTQSTGQGNADVITGRVSQPDGRVEAHAHA